MIVAVLTVRLYAPWVHSLKEKRSVIKSLLAKIKNQFNVSAAESAEQDTHQTLVLSMAALAADRQLADSILSHLQAFIEQNTDAEILAADVDYR